jgi:GGDEF domain-containing protein
MERPPPPGPAAPSGSGIALVCDALGRVQEVVRDDVGLSRSLRLGTPLPQVVGAGGAERAAAFLEAVRGEGAAFDREILVAVADGGRTLRFSGALFGERLFVVAAAAAGDPQGDLARRDAELARLHEYEQRRTRALEALQQATQAVLCTLDPQELAARVLDAALAAVPAACRGFVAQSDPADPSLRVRAASGTEGLRVGESLAGDCPCLAQALAAGDAARVYDRGFEETEHCPEGPRPEGGRSSVVVPFDTGEGTAGALTLCADRERAFGPEDVNLLAAFGAAAALAVRSVHLHAATRHLAERDALTGVLNRRGFAESVEREFRRARRFGRPLAVLLLVIDHFKRITEWHGNSVGDAVLMQVAGRCRKHLRADDVVGRRGPAEFAVLLVEASGEGAISSPSACAGRRSRSPSPPRWARSSSRRRSASPPWIARARMPRR